MPVVPIRIEPLGLPGDLGLPAGKRNGIVIFAHGSGSSRLSPRNRFVARELENAGLATLLFDLLTENEADDRTNVFDIPLLAERLGHAIAWTRRDSRASALPIGLFGASTGAAAALLAAARIPAEIGAIVSRGGRPDLADAALPRVKAPTLLIIGGLDPEVLALNRAAKAALRCDSKILIVPGATHLFEEPGTLERVVELARDWFLRHLAPVEK
ncbi:MAG TPA: dienelactone hydrolase family protein [Stellaceae bacterium]|nr:dienelactone hydrolase family protein [Stellaceae bacterium]